jgi:iron complex outermembrane recepter protein
LPIFLADFRTQKHESAGWDVLPAHSRIRDWTVKTQNFKNRSRFSAGVASAVISVAMLSSPAFAQAAAEEDAAKDEIVVTGSLIKNPNLEQSSPVGVVTAEEVELRQTNVAEQFLRELPSAVPSIGSAVNNGNGGASFVNLRGIGSNRNLVLLDGQRVAPADNTGRVDLNNIPLALVERTDILTGGATTTYGADAISGVVNFITKKDFSGLEASAGFGITEKGDGASFRTDLTLGANFDDGKGNAVFSVGYQEMDPVYQGARSFSVNNIDSFSGAAGGSGTSVPSRLQARRIDPATGLPSTAPGAVNGVAQNATLQLNPAGTQLVSPYAPFNFNPYNIFQTPFSRFNMYGAANYEVSDSVEVYSQGFFSKNRVKTIIAPSGTFGSTLTLPLSNPFIPAGVRLQLCAVDIDPSATGYTPRYDAATCAAAAAATNPTSAAYREIQVAIPRRFVEAGTRDNEYTTTVFNYGAGARGGITDNITWDVYGSYGESENVSRQTGNGLLSRLRRAVRATNATSCIDTDGGLCVPINLFGQQGSITPDQLGYLLGVSTSSATNTSLASVKGVISGDTNLTLGGEEAVSFATGVEYRKYKASSISDLATATPGEVLGNGAASPDVFGGYSVKEAFGELIVPTFAGITLEAGARYSDYSTAGGSFTWKVGGNWKPVEDIKIRGNFVKGARAPNIGELFAPQVTGLTNLSNDPCAGVAPTTNANLRAVCLAQGAPAGSIGSINQPSAGQANATSGGNPDLDVEKTTTWTIGAVVTPQAVPGFSVSIDYWNIKVKDAVSTATVGDVISSCFGNITAASATDPNCTSIRRNPLTGGLDGDTATTPGLPFVNSNLGLITTDGVDLSVRYKRDIGFAELGLSFDGTWTNSNKFQATPTSLNRECVGFMSANCGSLQPEFVWNQRTSLTFEEKYTLSFNWRHLSGVEQEPDDIVNGNGPVCGAAGNVCGPDQDFSRIGSRNYFDLSTRFEVSDQVTLTMTVTNLLNTKPKLVGSNVGTTAFNSGNVFPSTYDALGRRYGISAKFRF